jgi:hypothetical protein
MKKIVLILSLFIIFTSCSKKSETVSSRVKIVSALESIPATSDVVIYGHGPGGMSFTKKVNGGEINLEIPKGTWNIYAIAWDRLDASTQGYDGTPFTGGTMCGRSEGFTLSKNQDTANLELVLRNSDCADSAFAPFRDATESIVVLPALEVLSCINLTTVNDFSSGQNSCTLTNNRGHGRSYRFKVYDSVNFESDERSRSLALTSACYIVSSPPEFNLPHLPLNFPHGDAQIEVFYSDVPCRSSDGVDTYDLQLDNTDQSTVLASASDNALRIFYGTNPDRLYNPRNVQFPDTDRNFLTLSCLSGGARVTGYKIGYSTSPNPPPSVCTSASALSISSSTLTQPVNGLTAHTQYYFRVCSVDADGNTTSGVVVSATTDDVPSVTSVVRSGAASLPAALTREVSYSLSVTFSDLVMLIYGASGEKPRIAISLLGSTAYAVATSVSGVPSATHTFMYTPDYGDYAPGSGFTVGSSVDLNGAQIQDSFGNTLSGASLSFDNSALPPGVGGINIITVATCPSGYKHVPANAALGVSYNFCVMATEAKDNVGIPGSGPLLLLDAPWVSINSSSAYNACRTIQEPAASGTFPAYLISNAEWMTIARNIENVDANWSNDAVHEVGAGSMYRGHSDSAPSIALGISDSSDFFSNTGNNLGEAMGSGEEQKRTLFLNNDEMIGDFSGNVMEWVDWDHTQSGLTAGPKGASGCTAGAFVELVDVTISAECPLVPQDFLPSNTSFNSTDGMGKIIGSSNKTGEARRGGDYSSGAIAGIYSLNLDATTGYAGVDTGFRCVIRPANSGSVQ